MRGGRICIVCKDYQPYENFRREEVGLVGLGRICKLCRKIDAHADDIPNDCAECGRHYIAHRKGSRYCSDECRYKVHMRRIRKARARRLAARTNLDDA